MAIGHKRPHENKDEKYTPRAMDWNFSRCSWQAGQTIPFWSEIGVSGSLNPILPRRLLQAANRIFGQEAYGSDAFLS
jgi:hypothetical protein